MSREQIAQVLKHYRASTGMSVQHVCNWLMVRGHDIKPKTLYGYESGHRQPDADVLMRLCELYGIEDILQTFGYVYKEGITQSSEIDYDGEKLTRGELELLRAFRSLNPDGQELLLANARAFTSNVRTQRCGMDAARLETLREKTVDAIANRKAWDASKKTDA